MKYKVASELLKIKAVFLSPEQPFTWASGIQSPIYCDNRLTLSFPSTRDLIMEGLEHLITKKFPQVDYIMGTATAGIPHAAILANNMKLPMGYVRSSSKGHGRSNQIEGLLVKGANVVVVEDLISTGGSSIKVVETLRESGFNVLGVVAIFSYQLEAADKAFQSINLPYYSLSDYTSLLEVAVRENKIKESDLSKLRQWKKNPKDESWMSL